MKKMWGGRFTGTRDQSIEEFGASISFDKRLAPYDIQGSIAHATMLGETGCISKDDAQLLVSGLRKISEKLKQGSMDFSLADEDIHMNIERHLTSEVGPVAGKLHTARSRNDQVATDMHLFVREAILLSVERLAKLRDTLIEQAVLHRSAIMPGYTHLQRAQPVLFAHHVLAYVQMLGRDIGRMTDLWKRVNILPLGSGAIAGTTFPLNRNLTASLLNFDGVYENSMDAVSDRDFVIEFEAAAAVCMMHMSRLCEEIILWSTGEFGFIELDDTLSTGSSMMPQKKNPDFAELVRGKTGRVYGALFSILTTMKGLPLTYNKDMQEDKEGLFDVVDTLLGSLDAVAAMTKSWKVNTIRMREAAEQGFTNATDAADYLAKKGLPFRDAHEVVGKLVRHCIEKGTHLNRLSIEELRGFSSLFAEDVFDALRLENVVNRRLTRGGTGDSAVGEQIASLKSDSEQLHIWLRRAHEIVGV
ncbi:MAG: argininosuccinate lyase [Pseudomonadota bacterium]|jgi:argininosuccinate lyase